MLVGLYATVKWIPGNEHGPAGNVKTLEEWEVGRATPNKFATTRLAKAVEMVWKVLARSADRAYLVLDSFAGGDEREKREQEKQRVRMDEEMKEMNDRLGVEVNEINGVDERHVRSVEDDGDRT